MHFHIALTGSFLELYFAFRGVLMNNLALKKKCPGVEGKLNWPGLYCSLICIEP